MADFNSSLPVRTEAAGDVAVKIVDSVTPSQQLTVNSDGSVNITDNSGSLTVDAVDLDIRDLDSASDSVEAVQATHDDLNVNANIQVGDADVGNANPVPVSDAGGSLTVDATDLDIRNLVFATDKVDVSGSAVTATVTATDLDIRNLVFATDKVDVSGSSVTATVTATNLDIRDLTHATDSVKVGDGTDFLAVNADGSINVVMSGDVAGDEISNYQTSAAVAGGASASFDYTVSALKTFIGEQVWASGSGKIKVVVALETAAASGTYNTKFVAFNSTSAPNVEIPLRRMLKQITGAKVRVTITNRDNQSQDLYSTLIGSEI